MGKFRLPHLSQSPEEASVQYFDRPKVQREEKCFARKSVLVRKVALQRFVNFRMFFLLHSMLLKLSNFTEMFTSFAPGSTFARRYTAYCNKWGLIETSNCHFFQFFYCVRNLSPSKKLAKDPLQSQNLFNLIEKCQLLLQKKTAELSV